MNIEKFTDMLLNSLEKMEVPATTVEHITKNGGLPGVATSDDSQFLIKIGKCDKNDVDLDWLEEKLDSEDYRKLEKYIMNLCLKNDELIFRLGFRY